MQTLGTLIRMKRALIMTMIAVPAGETAKLTEEIKNELNEFILHVFDHIDGKQVEVGGFLDKESAIKCVRNAQS